MSLFAAGASLSRNAARSGSASRIPGAVASSSVIAHHGVSSVWRPVVPTLNNDFTYPQRFKGREQRKLHKLLKKHRTKYVIDKNYKPIRARESSSSSSSTAEGRLDGHLTPKPTFMSVPEVHQEINQEKFREERRRRQLEGGSLQQEQDIADGIPLQEGRRVRNSKLSEVLPYRRPSEGSIAQSRAAETAIAQAGAVEAETAPAETAEAASVPLRPKEDDAAAETSEDTGDRELAEPSKYPKLVPRRYNILMFGTDFFAYRVFHAVRMQGKLHKHIRVVTPPMKKHHAGREPAVRVAPVREHAIKEGLPHSDAPDDLSTWELPEPFNKYDENNVLLVCSFGRLIPSEIMANFPKGQCLNVHPSLLPELRGSAPMQWAVAKRLRTTGVTIQTLGETFDSGHIVSQDVIPLDREMITTTLEKLMYPVACKLVVDTLRDLPNLLAEARPQAGTPSFAPKIKPEHFIINYETMNAGDIGARVRALVHLKPITTYLQHGGEPGDDSPTRTLKVVDMRAAEPTEILMLKQLYPKEFEELMAAPPGHARWFKWHKNVKSARAEQGLIFVRTKERSKYASLANKNSPEWKELEELRETRHKSVYVTRAAKDRQDQLERAVKTRTLAFRDEGLAVLKECRAAKAFKPLWPKMVVSGYPAFKQPVSDFFYFRTSPPAKPEQKDNKGAKVEGDNTQKPQAEKPLDATEAGDNEKAAVQA